MIGGREEKFRGKAVDGDSHADTDFWASCTHTRDDNYFRNPWWRVDLEQEEPVNEVYIVNRGDCCGNRLNPFEIRVGKTKLHKALLKVIVRHKPRKMNRTKFSKWTTYCKHSYSFDKKPTY